jgi:hypothetical protein
MRFIAILPVVYEPLFSLAASESQRLQGAIALLRLIGLTPSPTSISESQPAQ